MASDPVNTIPCFDFSAFTASRDPKSCRNAAKKLAQCCQSNGCVGLVGHDISIELLSKAFDISKNLFDLPYEEKMKAPHPDSLVPHRGYSGPGREQASGLAALKTDNEAYKKELETIQDYKETYEIGSEENKEHYNIWLPEETLPGFRSFATDLYWKLHQFSNELFDALIMGIGLDEKESKYIKSLQTGHNDQLRLLHYPSVKQPSKAKKPRLIAHNDWSFFTLFLQDSCGGLEFKNLETGEFMPATPKDEMIYLNIGDMLMRVSNGIYPSSMHRVVAPAPAGVLLQNECQKELPERYSMAFFCVPDPDKIIYTPGSLIVSDKRMRFEPIIYRTYSEKLFRASQSGRDFQ